MTTSARKRILQAAVAVLISGTLTAFYVGFSAAAGDHRGGDQRAGQFRSSSGFDDDATANATTTATPTPTVVATFQSDVDENRLNRDDSTRPGFGCGDDNHTHTGAPGLAGSSFNPCSRARGEAAEDQGLAATTPTATATAVETATATATASASQTPTATATTSASGTPTATATTSASATPTATGTATASPTATATTATTASVSESSTGGGLIALLQAILRLFGRS